MKLKRLLALLLASAMLFTAFTACSSSTDEEESEDLVIETDDDGKEVVGNTYVEGLPIAVEPITYTIMNNKAATDYSASNNDKLFVELSTEGTNVSLEWTETSETLYDEQVAIILATGENMPDAFMYWPNESAMATNAEMFYELTDEILYTFAPNIVSAMEENVEEGLDALRKSDGSIYSLPTYVWSEYGNWASSILYIRQDWIEDLGMEMPSTVEELYEILTAFNENDMNGNGDTSDEIPYLYADTNWAGKLIVMAGSWGIAGRNLNTDSWYGEVNDGVYSLNITEDCFYDFITEMNKWSSEGLINSDGFTLTSSEYNSLTYTADSYGLIGTWTPTDITEYFDGKWAALPVLTVEGYEGEEVHCGEYEVVTANKNGFIISADCEEPEGLLRWWDNLHSDDEWKVISRDGEEGMGWSYNDEGVAIVTVPEEWPTGISSATEYFNTYGMRSYSALLFTGESPVPDESIESSDLIRYQVGSMYEEYFQDELIPTTAIPADASEEFSYVKTEIETAVANFYGSAVVNGFTDADWDAYLANLDALGIDEWVEYYQNYVDNSWD
ncbi:MAG: hypothetical protein R3Y35_01530 [Clostridia bacterium]